ncbi:CLUMA_CG003540, isoform A [Clunio marinus]|uniref:CLUMA_CG003540, isoform A n=1 Tax=Clunio marinus TaxID=568069 RepID=A0A1J1HQB9_9DIPT|nr:CLUMA_CG003540, isoform A [Clunio marinus]
MNKFKKHKNIENLSAERDTKKLHWNFGFSDELPFEDQNLTFTFKHDVLFVKAVTHKYLED